MYKNHNIIRSDLIKNNFIPDVYLFYHKVILLNWTYKYFHILFFATNIADKTITKDVNNSKINIIKYLYIFDFSILLLFVKSEIEFYFQKAKYSN